MLKPGDRFGDYTVVRLLGKGGMGAVYLLENAEGGQVAAKILDPASSDDHESRKRFLREAELALGVKHPNLVETYDVGEDPDTGLCYILMEYVPGGSLADRLKAGPLPVNDAVRIVYQIASVLELARQKGIVHRDIKPDNIMFGADGKAKLADLGIARGGVGGTETTTVTQTGVMIGTPAYMSPEQMLNSHAVDTRADIYSLGIVFYEMLAGKRPNAGDTAIQLMAKAVAGEPIPDVRTLCPTLSASLAELVNLMCAMNVDERVQTPQEVTTALSRIVHGHEVTFKRKKPTVVKKTGGNARVPVAAVVVGLAVAGGAALFWLGRPAAQPTGQTAQQPAQEIAVTNTVAKAIEPAGTARPQSPKVETRDVALGGGVTMRFVKCPAGSFTMGYRDSTWPSHKPHEVKISRPFWIGRTPVTVAEWRAFDKTYELKDVDRVFGHENIGVGRLTMERIHAYCAWLTEKHGGELPPGYVFRLPTDAEWEYACKAGSKAPDDAYVCGRFKAIEQERAVAAKLGDKVDFFKAKGRTDVERCKYDLLWPVATKRPNAWGLCDLIGHVAEPVLDTYPPVDNASGTILKQGADAVHLALPAESTDPLAVCTNADRVALMRASVELGQQRTGAAKKWRMWWSCVGCEGFRVVAGPDLLKERGVVFAPHTKPVQKPAAKEMPYSAGKATGPTPKGLSIALPQGRPLEFVGCPPGEFTMGYVNDRNDADWHRPHRVKISRPFWMLKYPVSCDQWAALAPLAEALQRQNLGDAAAWGMTFAEMGAYCRELTKRLPKGVPKGYVVRLPTEAEWEYALKANALDENDPHCRSTRKWRDAEEALECGAVIDGWFLKYFKDKDVKVPTPEERSWLSVYQMKANRWGVCGMNCGLVEPTLDTYPVLMAKELGARYYKGEWNHPLPPIKYQDHAVDPLAFCSERPCSRLSRGGGNVQSGMATKRFDAPRTKWGGHRYGAWSAGQHDYNRGKLRLVIGPDLLKERGQKDVDLEGPVGAQRRLPRPPPLRLTPRKLAFDEMNETLRADLMKWREQSARGDQLLKGCYVIGRLAVEGEAQPKDVATRTWLGENGTFVALVAPQRTLTFMKHGYQTLEIAVPEANGAWDEKSVYDYGTVTLKRFAKDEAPKLSCDVTLPKGIKAVEATLVLYNGIPIRTHWGTYGRERPSVQVMRKTFTAGEKVVFENCANATYDLTLSADGCATYKRQLSSSDADAEPVTLQLVKGAVFSLRPFSGGNWRRQAVLVNGQNLLLVKDETDEWGNRGARLALDPYKSPKGVGFHFNFGPDYYDDFGAMTPEAYVEAEKAGKLPESQKVAYGDRVFEPGHVYRMRENHWQIDLLISFDFYGSERDFDAYVEKFGRKAKIDVADEAVETFDYEARFPEEVPIGVELKRAGKAADKAILLKRDKLRDVRQYFPGLPHEFSIAVTKADAHRAMAEFDRRVDDYQKILTSATGRWGLKRGEKEPLVRRTKEDALAFLKYVLFVRSPAEPVAEVMRRRIDQLKRDLDADKTRNAKRRKEN